MSKKTILIIIAFFPFLALVTLAYSSKGVGIWHLYHMAVDTEGLYAPIITDNFEFHTKGFSKAYTLKPKYRDIYEVGIIVSDNTIPSNWGKKQQKKNKIAGKIKIELFSNYTKLSEVTATNLRRASFQQNNLDFYKLFSLVDFPIPAKGFKIKTDKIKITVLEPYLFFEKYQDNIKMKVQVSAAN